MRKHITVPGSAKKGPRHGTTTESNKKNSRREIKSYFSTPESSSSVRVNYTVNGKDRSPSSTHQLMAQSPYRTMTVTLKVNGQRMKKFLESSHDINQEIDEIDLISFNKFIANL